MNCDPNEDYPLAYGEKYCKRFLVVTPAFSEDVRAFFAKQYSTLPDMHI